MNGEGRRQICLLDTKGSKTSFLYSVNKHRIFIQNVKLSLLLALLILHRIQTIQSQQNVSNSTEKIKLQ